jgi:GNAT superfamily N-acetyltransferase
MGKRLPPKWRERLELVIEDGEGDWTFDIKFKKGQTPSGYRRSIGSLDVSEIDHHHFVESIFIYPKFRRKGLGTLLYETAIKHLGSLSTRYHEASPNAQECWRKLAKKYEWETDYFGGFLQVFNKKLVKSRKKDRETLFTYKQM